ncbi:acyl carrier protein [Helicobacter pylori]
MSVNFFKGIFNDNSRAENHQNNHQVGLKERYDSIARVLNSRIEDEGLEEYQSILDNEFLAFSSGVDSLKEKEIALLALQEIKKELQLVASYPSLFHKNMVAVGGGFSAGKSTFLNNLLGLKLKLPEDTLPTTAIPTYCFKGKKEVLMGFSQSYNPSNQGYTGGDKQASKESLKRAEHILWLISCERGGIEGDDLEYLQELYEEGRQVFIVVSRADRCTKRQLEEVAIKIKETLEDRGIEFLGIGTYSATRYQEIKEFSEKSRVFDSLEGFLRSLDKKGEKQNEILSVLYNVRLAYEKAIEQDANQFKRYQKVLHSIKLDLMQKGFDDFSDNAFNQIESLKKEFSEKEESKRKNLEKLNQVISLFKKSIDKVFDRVSAFTFEKYKEENDDEEDDEENRREFEEIKNMVLYCRDCTLFFLDCYDLNKKQIKEAREEIDKCNGLLQLHYSLENLQTLREFKEKEEEDEDYQEFLNNEELQNELREWRDGDKPGFFESIFNDLFGK